MQEDLHRTKDTTTRSQALYEKEIRRARKEAFKASSMVVKLQEDLKTSRDSLRSLQYDIVQQKARAEERERDAFAARYKLVGAQEELSQMRESARLLGEERDALKTSLKEEEVARVAAQGGISLPVSTEDEGLASARKTQTRTHASPQVQADIARERETLARLTDELRWARRRVRAAEEQVEHLRLECQFGCCACRLAEMQQGQYEVEPSLQDAFAEKMREMEEALAAVDIADDGANGATERMEHDHDHDHRAQAPETVELEASADNQTPATPLPERPVVAYCRHTGTFQRVEPLDEDVQEEAVLWRAEEPAEVPSSEPLSSPPPPPAPAAKQAAYPEEASLMSLLTAPHLAHADQPDPSADAHAPDMTPESAPAPAPAPAPRAPSPPPRPRTHRTITTTTTVPLAGGAEEDGHASSSWSSTGPHRQTDSNAVNGLRNDTDPSPDSTPDTLRHAAQESRPLPPLPLPSQTLPPAPSTPAPTAPATPRTTALTMTMTMTREEAIEQIRLRRGRARSVAAGSFTPRRPLTLDTTSININSSSTATATTDAAAADTNTNTTVTSVAGGNGALITTRRDISAPTIRSATGNKEFEREIQRAITRGQSEDDLITF